MNELQLSYDSGANLYAIIRRVSDSYVWQTTTSTFVAWVDGNIANYDVALTDNSGDYYSADFPAGITSSGNYLVGYFVRAGATPATTDEVLPAEVINWSGGAASGGTVGGNTITIGAGVTLLRVYGRNVGETDDDDTTYSLEEKHIALQTMLGTFARETRCIQTTNSFTITEDDDDIDLSGIAGFHTERVMKAWIDGEDALLQIIGIDEIGANLANDTAGDVPTQIAFSATTATGKIYSTPNDDYTGKVQWFAPLTGWTAGDTGVASTSLNIPADLAREVIKAGTIYYLQGNQPEHAELAAKSKMDFDTLIQKYKGTGNLGQRVYIRQIDRLAR